MKKTRIILIVCLALSIVSGAALSGSPRCHGSAITGCNTTMTYPKCRSYEYSYGHAYNCIADDDKKKCKLQDKPCHLPPATTN